MNDLNSRLSYLKMMVNSYYSTSYYGTSISKIYEETYNIKRKIHLIEKRKFMIKIIFKK